MIDIKKRKSYAQAKRQLVPGIYNSVVTNVAWSTKHGTGEAFEISYDVTSEGTTFQYREVFMNNIKNTRTMNFFDYLECNGIIDPIDFVGCVESLTFDYVEAYNGNTYINIVKRKFIG